MSKEVYTVTDNFEKSISRYTNSPYVVAVDSMTNALFLCLYRENIKNKIITIPDRTYVSVPCEIIHAGGKVNFEKTNGTTLKGAYQLKPTKIWDSALRFTHNMYIPNTHMCVSFSGVYKPLKLIKGGAILTDNYEDYLWFRRARFSGRRECSYLNDDLDMLGWNFVMPPSTAAMGLYLMGQFYDVNGTPKHFDDVELPYPDLSKFPVYANHQTI
jgi:dTDP-4-amino-4,6-dideoxygalactose transaminase